MEKKYNISDQQRDCVYFNLSFRTVISPHGTCNTTNSHLRISVVHSLTCYVKLASPNKLAFPN